MSDLDTRRKIAEDLNSVRHKLEFAEPSHSSYGESSDWNIGDVVTAIEMLSEAIARLAGLTKVKVNERTIMEREDYAVPEEE